LNLERISEVALAVSDALDDEVQQHTFFQP